MRIEGQASAGGPIAATGVPIPTTPLSRPGSDIASRMEAVRSRVSPVGELPSDPDSRRYLLKVSTRRGGKPVRFDRVEIAARYRRGATVSSIAADLGCTPATVYAALKDQGVPKRNSGQQDGAA